MCTSTQRYDKFDKKNYNTWTWLKKVYEKLFSSYFGFHRGPWMGKQQVGLIFNLIDPSEQEYVKILMKPSFNDMILWGIRYLIINFKRPADSHLRGTYHTKNN